MADVAVSVHRNPRDVENGTDDAEAHEEAADLKHFFGKKAERGESQSVPVVKLTGQPFVSPCTACFPVPIHHGRGRRGPAGMDRRLPPGQRMPDSPQTRSLKKRGEIVRQIQHIFTATGLTVTVVRFYCATV